MYDFHDDHDKPTELFQLNGLTYFLKAARTPRPQTVATDTPMTATERARYNAARTNYLSGGILVRTNEHKRAHFELESIFAHNVDPHGGSASLLISGDSTLGKTTLLKALMKDVYSKYRRRFPNHELHGRIPIVYIEVPPGCTGKLLMVAFADFFGIATTTRETADAIRHRVVAAIKEAGTQLVVVDELQNLNAENRGSGEAIDVLRNLHNQTRASYVYAGISIDSGKLVSGARGLQLRARSTLLHMTRFNLSNPKHAADWRGLVAAFESALPLHDHTPGTLLDMSTYLWERTAGSIGSLGRLLTGAANQIIKSDGALPERIDKELLETRTIDHFAETHYAERLNQKVATR